MTNSPNSPANAEESPHSGTAIRKLQVIVNPASGLEQPILSILNRAFSATDIDWDVSITHKEGDAQRLAAQAVADGCDVVGVYGGDGTVKGVACALQNTDIPMAIFPGGTGNALAGELGIPTDIASAMNFVAQGDYDIQTVDMGTANDQPFILRTAIGFEADMVKSTDTELKNRFGVFAYALSALNTIMGVQQIRYRVTVDGQQFEVDGIGCMIANSSNMAMGGLRLSQKINVTDGLLDLVIFNDVNLTTLLSIGSTVLTGGDSTENATLHHWQGKEITVDTESTQSVGVDGEFITELPVKASIVPRAVKILIPKYKDNQPLSLIQPLIQPVS